MKDLHLNWRSSRSDDSNSGYDFEETDAEDFVDDVEDDEFHESTDQLSSTDLDEL